MPTAPSPYRGQIPRWLENLGTEPPGPGVLEGPAQLRRLLAEGSPLLYRILEKLPEKIYLGIKRHPLPSSGRRVFGYTTPPQRAWPAEISLDPDYIRLATEGMKRQTITHEGLHALRFLRPRQGQGRFGWWPQPTSSRILSTAQRTTRFPPGYVDLLTDRMGSGHGALDIIAHELARRGGTPILPRTAPVYDAVEKAMHHIRRAQP